jgi:hypothetical protein
VTGGVYGDTYRANLVCPLRDHPLSAGARVNMGYLADAEVLVVALEAGHVDIIAICILDHP